MLENKLVVPIQPTTLSKSLLPRGRENGERQSAATFFNRFVSFAKIVFRVHERFVLVRVERRDGVATCAACACKSELLNNRITKPWHAYMSA